MATLDWNRIAQQAPGGAKAFSAFAKGRGANPYGQPLRMSDMNVDLTKGWQGTAQKRLEATGLGPADRYLPGGGAAQGPTPAPATNYDSMFRASIDRQRANIDAQLRSALSGVQQRQGDAMGLVARQPGEINANYDQAQPALQQAAAASAKTQQALNVPMLADANAGMEPIQAALAAGRANRLSDQPYLQIGTQDLYNRQRGALEQAAMEGRNALEGQQMDYYQQQALQQAQQKQQEDSFYAHTMFEHNLARGDKADESRAARKEENRQLDYSEPPPGTAKWWEWNMRRHPNESKSFGQGHVAQYAQHLRDQGEWGVGAGGNADFRNPLMGGVNTHIPQFGVKEAILTRGNKVPLAELLKRYKAPRYAKLRSLLRYQAQGAK